MNTKIDVTNGFTKVWSTGGEFLGIEIYDGSQAFPNCYVLECNGLNIHGEALKEKKDPMSLEKSKVKAFKLIKDMLNSMQISLQKAKMEYEDCLNDILNDLSKPISTTEEIPTGEVPPK